MGVFSLHEIFHMSLGWICFSKNCGQEDFNPQNNRCRVIEKHNGLGSKKKLACKWIKVLNGTWHTSSLWKDKILWVFKPYEYDFLGCLTKCLTCVIMPKKFLDIVFHNTFWKMLYPELKGLQGYGDLKIKFREWEFLWAQGHIILINCINILIKTMRFMMMTNFQISTYKFVMRRPIFTYFQLYKCDPWRDLTFSLIWQFPRNLW